MSEQQHYNVFVNITVLSCNICYVGEDLSTRAESAIFSITRFLIEVHSYIYIFSTFLWLLGQLWWI